METTMQAPKKSKKSAKKQVVANETPELKVVAPVVTPEVTAEVKAEKAPQKKRGPKMAWKRFTKTVAFVKGEDNVFRVRTKGKPKQGVEVVNRVVAYDWSGTVMPETDANPEEVKAAKMAELGLK